MKLSLFILALTAVIFSSCSSAYRTGQTPDDVYYSPARSQDEYVMVEKTDDRAYSGDDYYEDRYLRMRVQNRYRWSAFDDYYNNPYAYSPYSFYSNWNSPWNNYWAWNSYYNPYCGGGVIIKNPGSYSPPSRAVAFNPASYNNNNSRSASVKGYNPRGSSSNGSRYNNSNSNTLGSSIRRVFSGSNSNNSNNSSRSDNNSTPTRSYNPSSSSSSSSSGGGRSSGGSSSGGGSTRPPR